MYGKLTLKECEALAYRIKRGHTSWMRGVDELWRALKALNAAADKEATTKEIVAHSRSQARRLEDQTGQPVEVGVPIQVKRGPGRQRKTAQ